MRTLLRILFAVLFLSSLTAAATAQEALYNKLNAEMANHFQNERYAEAINAAKSALEVAEKTFGKRHPYVSASLNNLALLYVNRGDYEKAEPLYERSLLIAEKILGKNHPQLAPILEHLENCYNKLGKPEKARICKTRLKNL